MVDPAHHCKTLPTDGSSVMRGEVAIGGSAPHSDPGEGIKMAAATWPDRSLLCATGGSMANDVALGTPASCSTSDG